MRLHKLTPAQIEEWREARRAAGRSKYGDAHMQRYGLVDVMEELLDTLNILDLVDSRMYRQVDVLTMFQAQYQLLAVRKAIGEAVTQLLKADKPLPDHVCTDEQGGKRIWWGCSCQRA